MSAFGERIKTLRTERHLSRTAVAEQTGIPISRLSELERGVRIPVDSQTARIEAFYELGTGELAALVRQRPSA
ncbi:MAG: helix-turn-helix transcriptional regulator [Pseudomonadota bacterium]